MTKRKDQINWCDICNTRVNFNNPKTKKDHLNGKRHVKLTKLQNRERTYELIAMQRAKRKGAKSHKNQKLLCNYAHNEQSNNSNNDNSNTYTQNYNNYYYKGTFSQADMLKATRLSEKAWEKEQMERTISQSSKNHTDYKKKMQEIEEQYKMQLMKALTKSEMEVIQKTFGQPEKVPAFIDFPIKNV